MSSERLGRVHVDALVKRWSQSDSPPRGAPPGVDVDAFAAEVRRRFAMDLPDDYRRFLSLADGGQYDAVLFYGVGSDDAVLDRCADLGTGAVLLIGSAGNVDAYALRADGRVDIVNMFDLDEVYETFPCFTTFLEAILGRV